MSLLGISQQQSNSRKSVTGRYYFCASKHFGEITNVELFTLAAFITDNHQESCKVPHCEMQAILLRVCFQKAGTHRDQWNAERSGYPGRHFLTIIPTSSQRANSAEVLREKGNQPIRSKKNHHVGGHCSLRGLCWEHSWAGEGRGEGKEESQALPVPGGIGAGPLVLSPPLVQGSCLSLAQIAEAGRTHELQPAKSPHGQWIVRGG